MSEDRDIPSGRAVDRAAATILARVIYPEETGWPPQAARDLLRLRFPGRDVDRFHALLARHYAQAATAEEQRELESYLCVNYLLSLIHERVRRSLGGAAAGAAG